VDPAKSSQLNMKALLVLLVASMAWSQKTTMPWEVPCNREGVKPNLDLKAKAHLSGELTDPTGAPFSKCKVEIRKENPKGKFIPYRTGLTDEGGKFDLGEIESGKYRFLPAPNRGFKQPDNLTCSEQPNCELKLELALNPTDQPYAGCPIQ
jgi:hypothetical protein